MLPIIENPKIKSLYKYAHAKDPDIVKNIKGKLKELIDKANILAIYDDFKDFKNEPDF